MKVLAVISAVLAAAAVGFCILAEETGRFISDVYDPAEDEWGGR